jgi:hypothetical protein
MGREALCNTRVGSEVAEATALLEATKIVLRGTIRRKWQIAALKNLRLSGDELLFDVCDETVALVLGAKEAAKWLKKLQSPPPTLATKLGVSREMPALLMGSTIDDLDAELVEALDDAVTTDPCQARVLVAVVSHPSELQRIAMFHGEMICTTVWIVHPKGLGASPSDAEVRAAMRGWGYVDNKTSAVSARLTATRYVKRVSREPS